MGRHTDTTRRNVGGDHDGALASLELVQDPVTLVLLLVAVDGWRKLSATWDDTLRESGSNLQSAGQPS